MSAADFDDLLHDLMGHTTAVELVDILRDDVNRRTAATDAVAWLVDVIGAERFAAAAIEAGMLTPAGCWDAPEVTDDDIAQAEKDLADWVQTLNESEGDATIADECEQANQILRDLKEARDRVTVYYEDEDRPADAVPLYKVKG